MCCWPLPLAAWGARTGTPGPKAQQASFSDIPQAPGVGPSYPLSVQQGTSSPDLFPGAPASLASPSPQQPFSALEILQQRFARGEIDTPTFQQMRKLLE
ncbi:MAG: SHOCT domain-containing protein [Ktedonobacteraceae bacterium]|nr:SHOCT domain-containing protein [Ktedonobacteraceae bacterium]MBO0792454.1 SHOCT domain-containing protein [Ktedonobacteraceae bacterium]